MITFETAFQAPEKIEARRGVVCTAETAWCTYFICKRGDNVWLEAIGAGGQSTRMPHVSSVEQAKKVLWDSYLKPISPSHALEL